MTLGRLWALVRAPRSGPWSGPQGPGPKVGSLARAQRAWLRAQIQCQILISHENDRGGRSRPDSDTILHGVAARIVLEGSRRPLGTQIPTTYHWKDAPGFFCQARLLEKSTIRAGSHPFGLIFSSSGSPGPPGPIGQAPGPKNRPKAFFWDRWGALGPMGPRVPRCGDAR